MMKKKLNYVSRAGMIGAAYVVLVILQSLIFPSFLTFGTVQFRLAEGLTLLPLVEAAAVPGLFVGCFVANLILSVASQYGIVDIVCGSLATLLAAVLTRKSGNKYLGMIPPVAVNGIIVSIWVSYFSGIPYWVNLLSISFGEAVSVFLVGSVVLEAYKKALPIER